MSNYCAIMIETSNTNQWVLGSSFLRNYYTTFDDDNNQVTLSPHITSNATITKKAIVPPKVYPYYAGYYYSYNVYSSGSSN